uniref:Uncharacterized protein n=1 Tax=Aegilops tauschii subsp. strangulata TaxID=200361 RepID=A0A453RHL2_AEGTS
QIRFLASSIKYPPIPVEQKEDDKPFAPMQINLINWSKLTLLQGSIKG